MNNSPHFITLFKLGFVLDKVPQHIFQELKDETYEILNNNFNNAKPANYYLAGAIEHEYHISQNQALLNYLNTVAIPFYWKQWNDSLANTKFKYTSYPWVNFQRKHEYNPMHNHSGLLSFVIWVKIPYDIKKEEERPAIKNVNKETNLSTTGITFVYPDHTVTGGVSQYNIPLNNTFEGTIAIFPSFLKHIVYPFYTNDDYRISISGNLVPED